MKKIKDFLKWLRLRIKAWVLHYIFGKALKIQYKWNPFLKYPRNEACYCGSGVKYKKCCLNNEPALIRDDFATKANKLVKTMRKLKKEGRT